MSLPPEVLIRIVDEVVNEEMVALLKLQRHQKLDSRCSIALVACNTFFTIEIWKAFRRHTDDPNRPAASQDVFDTPWFDLRLFNRLVSSSKSHNVQECPVWKLVERAFGDSW